MEKIILDCDPGHDDAAAIMLAAKSPKIELLGITVVAGNQTLEKTLRNQELMQLMRLEKSLVFFATSLKSNENVLERLLRSDLIRRFPEDEDLLEDVIVENKQAIEMCTIYRDILSSTMDGFSSVISNNANDTMKVLTSLTLVLSIPTLIASIWGMNVAVPFEHNAWGFWALLGVSLVASIISIIILSRRKML